MCHTYLSVRLVVVSISEASSLSGADEANKDGRYPVAMHTNGHIDPDPGMAKLIKGENITRLLPEELQAVVRLNSDGEPGPKLLQLWVPKALSLCLQAPKAGQLSPVLAMCKQPVCIVQVGWCQKTCSHDI